VAIIQKGDLKTMGSVSEVLSGSSDATISIEMASDNLVGLQELLKQMPGVMNIHNANGYINIQCADNITGTQVNKWCFEKGIVLSQLNVKKKTLEKRFLEITGTQSDR
jgi:ABC-type uncharacterized transport system ATPase subunit